MRIYFEQRELFYIDVDTSSFEEALADAKRLSEDPYFDMECDADETGMVELVFFEDEETQVELGNQFPDSF